MKIVLAFDSMKGSLTAEQAVMAAEEGVRCAMPDADIVSLPLADGGEGTTDALCRYLRAEKVSCQAIGPLGEPLTATYAISHDRQTAIMEMATVAGLTLVPIEKRNPLLTTTYGVGEMMLDAVSRGCTHIMIGIGGSATCDGGKGMLKALDGHTLNATIDVICDVDNPLFGKNGAAYVYAPQKGADEKMVEFLDEQMRAFASHYDADPNTPGAGAAGGLGYGLMLIGGRLRRGIDIMLEAARLDKHLKGASLVITGEGKIDRQTLCGKLPFGVMQRATQHNIPTIALAGAVEDEPELLNAGFAKVQSINPPTLPPSEAMNTNIAYRNLRNAVKRIFADATFITSAKTH